MVIKEVREVLDYLCENSLVYDNPSFDCSIIGISTDGRVVYSLSKMIEEFSKENNISYEEAVEFIDYNTLNAYFSGGQMPIVVDDLDGTFEELKELQDHCFEDLDKEEKPE